MSRIGKKPIPLPKGVTYAVEGNTVTREGPEGRSVTTHMPGGVKLEQQDGNLVAVREDESKAAVHGLVRALVNNSVEGVTKGWTKELDIVGIGYRAELKGKGTVVFTLGYSHPIEYPLPAGIEVAIDPKLTHLTVSGIDRQKVGFVAAEMRVAASARSVQEQGRALHRRAAEEEGRQDGSEITVVSSRLSVVG